MEIEDQVLSIEQVVKLQNLGFDVIKNSSAIVIIKGNDTFIVNKEMIEKNIFGVTDKIEDMFYSMTIGDMIEVLPEKIKTYSANADKEVSFCLRINNTEILYISLFTDDFIGCWSKKDKLINNLFNTLVWCIKQKHI